jgi:hypothetical protein
MGLLEPVHYFGFIWSGLRLCPASPPHFTTSFVCALLLQLLLLQGVYVVFTFGTINLHLLRDDLCGKERLICSWPRKNWSYYATDNHTPPRRLSALDLP